MQQPGPMFPVMPSFPPTNITTEQIQKYLDENKKLILAILDNQNLGKLAECAQYQAQLQKNLMYLAAIADAQPQTPAMPAQMSPHPAMPTQGGGFYMPQQQQVGIFPPKSPPPPPFITPHHTLQDLQQQPPVQMALRPPPAGPSNGHGHDTTNRGGTSDAQGNNSAVGDGDETTK